ncbi:transcription elongation factor A 1-like, partial [Brachionus plicatilis]
MSDSPEVKNDHKNMKTENGKQPTIHKSSSHPLNSADQQRIREINSSIKFSETRDPVRQKCREMLSQALEITEAIENGAALCDVNLIAARCEEVIFNEFRATDMKYKNRIRSRVLNLKDAKNPKLRENVRLGLISPDKLAVMTAEEMANDDLKELRAKFTKEAIDDHQM